VTEIPNGSSKSLSGTISASGNERHSLIHELRKGRCSFVFVLLRIKQNVKDCLAAFEFLFVVLAVGVEVLYQLITELAGDCQH
jgi:hypothetical protein